MPLPDQSRMVLSGDVGTDRALLQERFDRVPVFEPRTYAWRPTGPFNTNSGTFVLWGSNMIALEPPDVLPMQFHKQESWTDVLFHLHVSAYLQTAAGIVNITLAFDDVPALPGCRTTFTTLNAHGGWSGVCRVRDMAPGFHTVTPAWATAAGLLNIAINDFFSVEIRECLPETY